MYGLPAGHIFIRDSIYEIIKMILIPVLIGINIATK